MLDLNYVRENLGEILKALQGRGASEEMFTVLAQFSSADKQRRRIIAESDQVE